MFGLQGLGAFLILVVVLVSIWIALAFEAVQIQRENATNYYKLEQTDR